ncbi:hypothetical protein l11_14100 [Neisseria weaveri LMG 5135]|nr:hypothetical protein l11_14100 [Neisseria weaveri LMG 5135]
MQMRKPNRKVMRNKRNIVGKAGLHASGLNSSKTVFLAICSQNSRFYLGFVWLVNLIFWCSVSAMGKLVQR